MSEVCGKRRTESKGKRLNDTQILKEKDIHQKRVTERRIKVRVYKSEIKVRH